MPELPEVETVRRGLKSLVLHKTIAGVTIYWPKIIESPDTAAFTATLIGETIQDVNRRGKYLIVVFDDVEMISHLRMEGKYDYFAVSTPPGKHTHVVFTFTDGSELHYQDVRKFGRMALVAKGKAAQYKGIQKLGPEPVEPDFELKAFQARLKRVKKAIKPALLDQTIVTGLGNIYVDEALWRAKIHPETSGNVLTEREVAQLHEAIIDVLAQAVTAGGTTIRTYQNALGEAGNFQTSLYVYGQQGTPCARCGTPIIKCKVAQRGTHLCPHCQQKKEGGV